MRTRNGILIGGTIAALIATSITPASASLPGYNSPYWFKTRTVHVKKAVTAYQINPNNWQTHKKKHLKKGTKIKISNTANLSWVLKSSKLKASHGYVWVVKGHYNTSWLKK
ncbi:MULTISPECIES: hypothetical protein [Levilactobacillus]|uniref:hypothetical protein n=1 Tax=Levilactobacillus TaxID=2767886 RepID=UPI001950955E|nr:MULTISPECIES: hypothetical protein [Levilactobacillus]